MIINKKCNIDGEWFDRYQIKQLQWDLESKMVGALVLYYKVNLFKQTPVKVKTHYFGATEEIDVNELIEKIKELHNK